MKTKVLVLSIAIWSGAAIGAEATGFQKPGDLNHQDREKPIWTMLPRCKDQLDLCWTRKNYENGVYYIGEWKAGKRHGLGKLSTLTSSTPMIGFWREDLLVSDDRELSSRLALVMSLAEELEFELKGRRRLLNSQLNQTSGKSIETSDYASRLSNLIRSNTVFTNEFEGNPRAEFHVTLSPECEVLDVRLKSSSGHTGWDRAAEFSIRWSSPFPKPPSGACPGAMLISHQPKKR